MDQKITSKSFILSMLQASNNKAMPVKAMVSAGKIFGFTGNTIRVTTTRLIRERTIESDERGLYRLSDKSIMFSQFIESWRLGENRQKEWNGSWLCYLTPKVTAKRHDEAKKAFDIFGFKEGLPGFWVRPDNLSIKMGDLESLLLRTVRIESGEMFIGKQFSEKLNTQWQKYLWPVEKLLCNQKEFLVKMEKSADRIETMPLENALVESYLIGSKAIRLLFTDPLLPKEIMDNTYSIALSNAMLAYDEIGKRIWSKRFEEIQIDKSPTQLQLVARSR